MFKNGIIDQISYFCVRGATYLHVDRCLIVITLRVNLVQNRHHHYLIKRLSVLAMIQHTISHPVLSNNRSHMLENYIKGNMMIK